MTAAPLLLVADHVAGVCQVLALPGGTPVARLEGRHLSEHAGFLALPHGRVACVDDRAGELLVLAPFVAASGGPLIETRVPVAVPAEHLAADRTGRRLAVTTGLGRATKPWSDLLTVVDLPDPGGPGHLGNPDRPDAVRVRTRTGEPGVTLHGGPDPVVVLRERAPGRLAAHRHADLLAAPPGCPAVTPYAELPLPDDGHGDAADAGTGRVFAATGEGVHRARLRGDRLVAEEPLSWSADGRTGGRGYYLRLDPRHRTLWSSLRGGPADPPRWPEWTNDAWWHHLGSGRTGRLPLGPGLVFRMAVARDRAAFTRVHPDGDELILVRTDLESPAVAARTPLPPMDGAPRPGAGPWEGVQRRAVAASPGASLVAVSRGGHGEVHLFDAEEPGGSRLLHIGTALDHGGGLALLAPDDGAEADQVGR
ncbi:hypothetical protein LHJ74_26870 [Streptomyces sp. N2-109]|uniref:Uncharacterized protein n=1 Tax=Streptomyces gossypii TaxID=2883101 RepID=A0ABT2K0J2_9ACTN|nr:hypothetical protein [Streptomyces gossypii]MCT2593486.1 hypothetical protein [Streptomyces gossypii]